VTSRRINKILHNFPRLSLVNIIFGKFLIVNMRLLLFSLILIVATVVNGQDTGILEGSVRDSIGDPVEFANVSLQGTQVGTMTEPDGSYTLEVPSGRSYTVIIS